jgi:hypothetical protein
MTGETWARVVAALGMGCGIAAVFLSGNIIPTTFSDDGTLSALLLVLEGAALVLLAVAQRTGRRGFDLAAATFSSIALGVFLFGPIRAIANGKDEFGFQSLGLAAWLGVASALAPLALLSLPPGPPRTVRWGLRTLGRVLTLLGAALVIGGIWPDSILKEASYWDISLLQPFTHNHNLGITFLLIAVLATVLTFIAPARNASLASDSAVVLAAIALGLTLWAPALYAFTGFAAIQTGGWLTLAGAAVLLGGTVLARGTLHLRRG